MFLHVKRCALCLVLSVALPASAQSIGDLGTLGGTSSYATAVNATGDVVIGYSDTSTNPANTSTRGFRWTASSNTMTDIGTLGGTNSYAYGVNAVGDIVVGNSLLNGNVGLALHAFRWSASSNAMTDLGTLGGANSYAKGINAVGDVVIGYAQTPGIAIHAFRWTLASSTMTDLGTLGGTNSYASGINAVGDIVVGNSHIAGDTELHAFRWTGSSNTMTDLGTLGGINSYANGVNAIGDVVIGYAQTSGGAAHAFRWTAATGSMVDLGTLGGTNSYANSVNAAGNVVVGYSETGSAVRAFRWTPNVGMQSVEDWLAANGVKVSGANTTVAYGTNADGNVVVGLLSSGHAFLARVASTGAGMIDVQEFSAGLAKVANSGLLATNDAETVMNGMHSNPMRSLLGGHNSTFWVAGDAGRHDGGPYDSMIGMVEIGYGHRFDENWQLNASIGRTYNQADTGLGGRTIARTTYLAPEVIVTLPASLYATVTGYYGQGRADIDRAYLSAGTSQSAFGAPSLQTVGARLRVDWLDALALSKAKLTPYSSLTYMRTRTDGYREQGGAFPVIWNQRIDKATTARLGLDALYPLSEKTLLQGRVEAAHRFEKTGAATSGQIVGLNGFGFSGQNIKRDWLRFSAGVESKMGRGIASVMLNTTTQGEAPTYWMAASYRWEL